MVYYKKKGVGGVYLVIYPCEALFWVLPAVKDFPCKEHRNICHLCVLAHIELLCSLISCSYLGSNNLCPQRVPRETIRLPTLDFIIMENTNHIGRKP